MSDTITENPETSVPVSVNVKKSEPAWWFVRVSHPKANKRKVFRSISETRARAWLEKRCPRGEEMYLEGPDGQTESYQHGRLDGEMGTEVNPWQPFNPEEYVPPEEALPPGAAGWPDVEG